MAALFTHSCILELFEIESATAPLKRETEPRQVKSFTPPPPPGPPSLCDQFKWTESNLVK